MPSTARPPYSLNSTDSGMSGRFLPDVYKYENHLTPGRAEDGLARLPLPTLVPRKRSMSAPTVLSRQ